MSTSQADISKSINVRLVKVRAATGTLKETVRATPISVHKWASRVGMHNDDPIWGEIFQNVRDSRKQARKQSKPSE